jgi:hypothetical protein
MRIKDLSVDAFARSDRAGDDRSRAGGFDLDEPPILRPRFDHQRYQRSSAVKPGPAALAACGIEVGNQPRSVVVAKTKLDPVKWLQDVTDEDYQAAATYLSLIDTSANIGKTIAGLKATSIAKYKATDLLRASQLELPESDDSACRKEIKKIEKGEALSPVLLVRDVPLKKVIIADGFHRICAAYRIDPNVVLHCKLV